VGSEMCIRDRCNVFPYADLKYVTDINELFDYDPFHTLETEYEHDENSCIIIFLTKDYFGHWCILNRKPYKNKYIYSFLDSYGEMIDDQLDHIDVKYRKKSGQTSNYLSDILYNAVKNTDDQVRYNDIKMQVLSDKIATCGRYAALFLKHNDMLIEDFVKTLENAVKKYRYPIDVLVTMLTI
jgi:hypothetical protein